MFVLGFMNVNIFICTVLEMYSKLKEQMNVKR